MFTSEASALMSQNRWNTGVLECLEIGFRCNTPLLHHSSIPVSTYQVAEKRCFMLREPQHERNFLIHFKSFSVRPEPVEGLRESFSATC